MGLKTDENEKIVKIVYLYILRILKGGKNAFGYKKLGVGSIICHPMRIIGKNIYL